PAITTAENIATFRRQMKRAGLSYDWAREINTTDPAYYRWTQWIFLRLLERGLAYVADVPVNWCPALGTVLANEEIIDGKSEVGGFDVVRKPMRQWVLKITAYADRLLEDLKLVEWPASTLEMQKNWIGRSIGAEVDFSLADKNGAIMAVPAHDERDWAFARTYKLTIREVIAGGHVEQEAYVETGRGKVINSTAPNGSFSINGMTPAEAIPKITAWLESTGKGKKA